MGGVRAVRRFYYLQSVDQEAWKNPSGLHTLEELETMTTEDGELFGIQEHMIQHMIRALLWKQSMNIELR